MQDAKPILGPMRLPFLVLTPACYLVGLGTALWTTGSIDVLDAVLTFVGALASHISVNAFNEYFDFKSGLDLRTTRTPFSGGSGTLPMKPEAARTALMTAIVSLVIAGAIGLYFLTVWGWALLPLGLLGMLVVFAYTPWLTKSPLFCLIAPGLGFGPLMVMGTHFALTGAYTWSSFAASLIPFFLVSNLLLINQFPDVEADRSIGRRHYPITIGRRKSSIIYFAFLALNYVAIIAGVAAQVLPMWSLLGLATLILAIPLVRGVHRHAEDVPQLVPSLGLNVLVTIATPVLVSVGLLVG